ncbi:hypothetical protein GALMADRAFT_143247 [Galerina marginata CBS 339.88]|uniref:Uncharacterized protein n=1 Tax=Galerina marginata (strain CBS 339.88) TaxID=685588 RepID=A0A067SND1_GALM3|nr:hypothetical protein GALMADRAFT_143247 [Galerina marginata CBS 339.88]
MPAFERTWRGNDLTTTWNKPGASPKSFNVEFEIDFDGLGDDWKKGPIKNGRGTSIGQDFTIRNGRFDFTRQTVNFDMIFDENHPSEEFSGLLNSDSSDSDEITSITGTIKVKESWLQGKPQNVYTLYSRYRAWVTLR